MNKRILAIFLAAACLVCLLAGCKGEATPEQDPVSSENAPSTQGNTRENVLNVGISQDLDNSLDPFTMTAAGTREVMFNVFEGLVKADSDGDYYDAVASERTVSEDGLTYTFQLRDNVVFHNGNACTLEDVLYSFDTCAATTTTSAVAAALSAAHWSGEGSTLTVTLDAPNPDFLSCVACVYIVPKDYADQATAPIGTGPFKFVSRSVQENVILAKNEAYYGIPASLDGVNYRVYEDNNALFTALDSGSLDLVAHLTSDQVANLSNGYDVLEGTMNLVQAIFLNNDVAPFDSQLVRQAMCYAIDVQAMLDLTSDGHGTPVGSAMYPNFGKYFDAELANAYPHDVEKAKALLTEAGYPEGFTFTIKVPSNYTPHVNTAMVLAQQLKEVGITAEISQVDWNTWLTDVYSARDYEGTVCGFDASVLTASAMLARYCSDSSKNMFNYANAEFDETYAAAQATTDDEEQTALYRRCLEILSETAANVYTQDLADFVALNPEFEGFTFYPMYVIDMSKIYLK